MGAVFVNNLNDVNDPDDHLLGSGVRLITLKELEDLGCNLSSYTGSCSEAPSFITETTYWTGSAGSSNDEVWCVDSKGSMSLPWVYVGGFAGVRPIITILESDI